MIRNSFPASLANKQCSDSAAAPRTTFDSTSAAKLAKRDNVLHSHQPLTSHSSGGVVRRQNPATATFWCLESQILQRFGVVEQKTVQKGFPPRCVGLHKYCLQRGLGTEYGEICVLHARRPTAAPMHPTSPSTSAQLTALRLLWEMRWYHSGSNLTPNHTLK